MEVEQMRYYYNYSERKIHEWKWMSFWPSYHDFTIIDMVLINPLKCEFKRVVRNIRIASMRIFTHTRK